MSPWRVKGRRPKGVSSQILREPEAVLRLLSGASARPKRASQRRRPRMVRRKRWILATTGAGCSPASTCSKCRRASVSSPFRKKARASSSRTRTSSGRLNRMDRKAATARSRCAARASSCFRLHGGFHGRHAGAEAPGGVVRLRPPGGRRRQQGEQAEQDEADREGFHGGPAAGARLSVAPTPVRSPDNRAVPSCHPGRRVDPGSGLSRPCRVAWAVLDPGSGAGATMRVGMGGSPPPQERTLSPGRGRGPGEGNPAPSTPMPGGYYLRVAYAPAAWPFEKWALKVPNIPTGRSSVGP